MEETIRIQLIEGRTCRKVVKLKKHNDCLNLKIGGSLIAAIYQDTLKGGLVVQYWPKQDNSRITREHGC